MDHKPDPSDMSYALMQMHSRYVGLNVVCKMLHQIYVHAKG